jgi:hypothetical protein
MGLLYQLYSPMFRRCIKSSELQSIFTSRDKRKDTRKPKKKKGDEQGKTRTNLIKQTQIVNNSIAYY